MVRARITSKGQVTIPKAVRDALNLKEASVVEFDVGDGVATLKPVGAGFLARYGSVKPRSRPEDWARVRAETASALAEEARSSGQ